MSYAHLTPHERYCIAHMHCAKYAIRRRARTLNRSPSTSSREVKRNKGPYSPYWYDWAQQYADERKAAPRNGKRKSHAKLYDLVMQNIRLGLSPEINSGRLNRELKSENMRVSHETIYQWILLDARQGGNAIYPW